jgi:hypothetical protein
VNERGPRAVAAAGGHGHDLSKEIEAMKTVVTPKRAAKSAKTTTSKPAAQTPAVTPEAAPPAERLGWVPPAPMSPRNQKRLETAEGCLLRAMIDIVEMAGRSRFYESTDTDGAGYLFASSLVDIVRARDLITSAGHCSVIGGIAGVTDDEIDEIDDQIDPGGMRVAS